jgi:DNA-binding XRE family transcriptional regulator
MTTHNVALRAAMQVARLRRLPSPEMRRALRHGAGLSAAQLGEIVGVPRQTICRWELGQRNPSGRHFDNYIEALDALREVAP